MGIDDEHERRQRSMTDQDIKALADELESRFASRFYRRFGEGVFGLIWKGMIYVAIAIAAYGAGSGRFSGHA